MGLGGMGMGAKAAGVEVGVWVGGWGARGGQGAENQSGKRGESHTQVDKTTREGMLLGWWSGADL